MTTKKLTIKDLIPDDANFNTGTEFGNGLIEKSLQKFGAGRSILLDRNNRIIAGNKTIENAAAVGLENVVVVETTGDAIVAVKRTDLDLDDKRTREFALADNATAKANISWDSNAITEWEMPAAEWGVDLAQTVEPLQEDEAAAAETINKAAELQKKWGTATGQLWKLDRHRILCGDSRSDSDVQRLTVGVTIQMVFADPPYGVEIVSAELKVGGDKAFGKVGTIHRGMKAKPIIEANTYAPIIGDSTTETAVDAYLLAARLFGKAVHIWWGGNYYANALPPSSCWLVWDKENGESFFADAELAWTNQKTAVRKFSHMWNGLMKASEKGERRVHPTQKPVALAEWCFEQYGNEGDTVFDPFLGSAMSLIAAENKNRTVYGIEMSPDYIAAALERWANLTGKTPELIEDATVAAKT